MECALRQPDCSQWELPQILLQTLLRILLQEGQSQSASRTPIDFAWHLSGLEGTAVFRQGDIHGCEGK